MPAACPLDQRSGGAIAQAEAGTAIPGGRARSARCSGRPEALLQRVAKGIGAGALAGDVVANVNGERRPFLERKSRVEARDAIGVGGWDRETPAGVLEGAAADPARVVLHRVQHGQEQVTAGAGLAAAVGKVIVRLNACAALPQGFGSTEESVDGGDLLGCRRSPGGPYVQLLGRDRDQLVDPDRARLELGRARFGIGGVDGEDVGGHLVREMEGHEGKARAQRSGEPNRHLN